MGSTTGMELENVQAMNNNNSSNSKLERMFSMKGGKGESSYANNSQAQARHARSMIHTLKQTLDRMDLSLTSTTNLPPFTVVDLGCSSGSNTIHIVNEIVTHVKHRYEALGFIPPEFLAYFSDLPSNDFNTLFQLLPPYNDDDEEKGNKIENGGGTVAEVDNDDDRSKKRCYFAAAVPGSFYRRLFPSRYVDVFYSAFSLHWLSQVPEAVTDKRSESYNMGKVFIHGAKECTANAYKKQFQSDLTSFLKARSLEMKRTGTLFLLCLGRSSTDPTDQGGAGILFGTHFQEAWNDLVQEGLITCEKRDTFNIPVYASSIPDFNEVVNANGSFTINKLELFRGGSPLVLEDPDSPAEVGQALANTCRSVAGVLVEAHIGEELSDEFFRRVAMRGVKDAEVLYEKLQFDHIVASLTLKESGVEN